LPGASIDAPEHERVSMTVAELIVTRLARAGARAIFGMPGGGSNLDIIDAARRHRLPFVLSHTETAGAIMAAAQAEITGAPGVCLSTLGPGVSSLVNGVAHAWLDRVPLVVLTDTMGPAARSRFEHQSLPHAALLGPITRFTADLTAADADAIITDALARATGRPPGPVHIDCAPDVMAEQAAEGPLRSECGRPAVNDVLSPDVRQLLREAKKPLAIAGLGARSPAVAAALQEICERRGMPAAVTYKAKGVIADFHPLHAGLFTLGEIEKPLVDAADLLLAVGLDPVELLPRPWPWRQPLVRCAEWSSTTDHLPGGETIVGDLAAILREVDGALSRTSRWTPQEIAAHRERQRAAVLGDGGGLTPGGAADAIANCPANARHVTVDAGAHMFAAMSLLRADAPGRILISNGLSTMGYAVPAAIGAALLAPQDPVIALTGDAGLLMCLGELRTAAREGLRIVVVVFADGELSLIRIKQDRRGLEPAGVRIGEMDWPRVATGLGLRAFKACTGNALRDQLAEALAGQGPALIEARVDPSGYGRMLHALRG
jgi:acetolactate synthase I/II/III large subunit